jgi:hypothetical protein
MSENITVLSPDKDIKISKWIVHRGSQVSNGSVLLLYQETDSDQIERLKNTDCGIVKKLLHKEGIVVKKRQEPARLLNVIETNLFLSILARRFWRLQNAVTPPSCSICAPSVAPICSK